jgi:hypothetical protein
MRGQADAWPGVAAAKRGDRAIAEYLLGFGPTRPVGGIMLPAEAEGRFFYDPELTGFNFSKHQGELAAFLGELLRIAGEPGRRAWRCSRRSSPNCSPASSRPTRCRWCRAWSHGCGSATGSASRRTTT